MTGIDPDEGDETRSMLSSAARTTLQKLGGTNLARAIQRKAPAKVDELWNTFGAQGWLGILVSEEAGGSGLGVREMAVIAEELGRIAVASAFSASAVMASVVLADGDAGAGMSDHLDQLIEGRTRYVVAWGEQRFPDEQDVLHSTIAPHGDGDAVTGTKRLVVSDDRPGFYIVAALRDNEPSLCLVSADAPGVESSVEYAVDGTYYRTVTFRNAPVAQVIASGAAAQRLQAKAIEHGLLSASAELYGLMSAALKLTLEYMRTRVQFGRPIGSFQALQHRAADLFIQKDLSFSVLQEALATVAAGAPADERYSAVTRAKARCSDAALRIVKDAVQLHGAIGYTDEYDLGCYVKRAMVLSAWLGNGTQQRRKYFRATYLQ